ncbi:MAG: hypothetical protein ACK4UN_06230 [Limisphaerales bacterium]
MKVKNILLAVSLIGFAVGFSDYQENMLVWLGRPVGAIFAIAYFICVLLEKPFSEFDAEQGTLCKSATPKKDKVVGGNVPALSTATS